MVADMTPLFTRMTGKGELAVSLDGRRLVASLAGERLAIPALAKLPKPLSANGTTYTHCIGSVAITAAQHDVAAAALKAAEDAYRATPEGQREALALRVNETDTEAFPGSRAWQAHKDACDALAAFDASHPEIFAAIQAEHAAEMADGFIARGLD